MVTVAEWQEALGKFLESVVNRVIRAGGGPQVSDVVDSMQEELYALPSMARNHLLRVGATKMANDMIHDDRDSIREAHRNGDSPVRSGKFQHAGRFVKRLEHLRFMVADGTVKAIEDFLVADFAYIEADAKSRRAGYAKMERWAKYGREECESRRVGSFRELPKSVQDEIEGMARE